MNNIKIVFSSLVFLASNAAFALEKDSLEDSLLLPLDQWVLECSKYKSTLSDIKHKYTGFTKFTRPINKSLEVSFININELEIPLPKAVYEIPSFDVSDNSVHTIFKGPNGMSLSYQSEDLVLLEDFWSKRNRKSGTETPTVKGIEYTKAMYGGPVGATQITIDSLIYTPDDLVCDEANRTQDMRIALALGYKGSWFEGFLPMISYLENSSSRSLIEFLETPEGTYRLNIQLLLNEKLHRVWYFFNKDQKEMMFDIAALYIEMNEDK